MLSPCENLDVALQFEQLGPYRIGRKLGRGGMGTVFAGEEIESGTPAAVKVLASTLAHDEGFRARFESEIETLRMLRHPNIVRLFGFGEHEGHLFYAMELVDGTSLEDELQRGRRFEWREVTRIGIGLCRALRHAHDRGVIHRDIKPANIMLAHDGTVKLSDFGIAKLFGSAGLTADGGVIGTAEYMAPEQADGRPVTYRSDLYSLGGVLFALLAGRPPFQARSLLEMLQMQRFAEPEPVRRFAPNTPEELEIIISDLLAKEPSDRVANAQILARRLEATEHGLTRREQTQLGNPPVNDTPTVVASGDVDSGFELAPLDEPEPDDASPGSTLAATMATGDVAPPSDASELGATIDATQQGDAVGSPRAAGGEEAAFSLSPNVETVSEPPQQAATSTSNRFVTVDEDEDLDAEEDEPTALISPQTWILVGALLIVGLGTWYYLQPVPADRLYDRVSALAAEENIETLVQAEDDIQQFLTQYPNDRRSVELRTYLEEIELYHAQRRFERRARFADRNDAMTPVERAYLEAIRYAQQDPEQGFLKLEALLNLYRDEKGVDAKTQHCLDLARSHAERLQAEIDRNAADQLNVIRERMNRADELRQDDPDTARAMWRGVIELYGNKPWAAEEVDRARDALANLTEDQPASPPIDEQIEAADGGDTAGADDAETAARRD